MSEGKPQKSARDPQSLSGEYHKARKQLMLWAGILFIWELVGIDLEKAREAGGNAGAIITAIKSPQAVPWVLLILVTYFLFKTAIEWYQCSSDRRSRRVSRVDFASAIVVSGLAFALYVGQAISRSQLADLINPRFLLYGMTDAAGTFGLALAVWTLVSSRKRKTKPSRVDYALVFACALCLGSTVMRFLYRPHWVILVALIAITLTLMFWQGWGTLKARKTPAGSSGQ